MKFKRRWLSLLCVLAMMVSIAQVSLVACAGGTVYEIQEDIPNLKDVVTKDLGEDFIVGTAIAGNEVDDAKLMALVKKHFNAVTIGNELKPDCTFGYSNDRCPGKESVTLNGKTFDVPKLDFSRAEKILDVIYAWNEKHPNEQIKVRGHVFTWHSQTPEWFFHEEYDAAKPYCSKEEMTLRHEWYIKAVAEHYMGVNSKYKDMFYGWDVVNEAVSDGRGTYRNGDENSSWWRVYESNEFIINAFVFANKYVPANVELYYNDYNDAYAWKSGAILQLVKDVQAAKGTRIDGVGMQGHYKTDETPTIEEFLEAARLYAQTGLKIQLTELDFEGGKDYDGTNASVKKVYEKNAARYGELYEAVKTLKKEGVNFTGMTVWGVIDSNSWLWNASFVGGGSNGKNYQAPLLFDGNYQAKPAFWAIVDPSKKVPFIQEVEWTQAVDNKFSGANEFVFGEGSTTATAKAVWSKDKISFQIKVKDKNKNSSDKMELYIKVGNQVKKYTVKRAKATKVTDGYMATIQVPYKGVKSMDTILFDIVVTNDSTKVAYNDTTFSQASSLQYYAKATLKPMIAINKGTVKIGKNNSKVWKKAESVPLDIVLGADATGTAKLLWDKKNLYVRFEVKDAVLNADSMQAHEKDSVEIFIDENNAKSGSYQEDDKQYRINYLNEHTFNGSKCVESNVKSVVKLTKTGYVVEASFAWTDLAPKSGKKIGLELQINDAAASGVRIGTTSWFDTTGTGWSSPAVFGTAVLK